MKLKVDREEFNTILGALRLYQRLGMGEPDQRPMWLQDIVAPTVDDTSLDAEGIDGLCVRINT